MAEARVLLLPLREVPLTGFAVQSEGEWIGRYQRSLLAVGSTGAPVAAVPSQVQFSVKVNPAGTDPAALDDMRCFFPESPIDASAPRLGDYSVFCRPVSNANAPFYELKAADRNVTFYILVNGRGDPAMMTRLTFDLAQRQLDYIRRVSPP